MRSSLSVRLGPAWALAACALGGGCGGGDSTIIGNAPDSGGGNDGSLLAETGGDDGGLDSATNPDSPSSDDGSPNDSSQANDGGDADAGFNVGSVPNLVLWLDAAKGVTLTQGKVSLWADQTVNHNDASQSASARQPSVTAQAINGLPGIHFDAGGDAGIVVGGQLLTIADSASLEWGTGDFLIEAVLRYDNTPSLDPVTSYGVIYNKEPPPPGSASGGGPALFANSPIGPSQSGSTAFVAAVDPSDAVLSAATGNNDGKGHLVASARNGTTLEIRVGGASSGTKTIPTVNVDATNTPVRIGADGDANLARLDGDIAEIIAVKGTVAASDLNGIEAYLKSKYGL
jgi:hypothetical protein